MNGRLISKEENWCAQDWQRSEIDAGRIAPEAGPLASTIERRVFRGSKQWKAAESNDAVVAARRVAR